MQSPPGTEADQPLSVGEGQVIFSVLADHLFATCKLLLLMLWVLGSAVWWEKGKSGEKNFRLALILLLRCLELVFLLGLLWGFCRNAPPPTLCSPSYSTRSRSVRLLLYLSTQPPFPIASSFRSSVALPESPLEQGKKCPQASSIHEILSSSPRNMLLHCPNKSPPAPPACLSDLNHLMSHTPGKTF